MRAQVASPTFTHVYAALVAILNTKVCLTYFGVCAKLLVVFIGYTWQQELWASLGSKASLFYSHFVDMNRSSITQQVSGIYRGFIKFLCRRSVGFFRRAFLVFLMKESKKRRWKQPGKVMAKSRSQLVNLPRTRPLTNPLHIHLGF